MPIPERVEFTREMKKDYTILAPMMLPTHFEFIQNVLRHEGYHVELLRSEDSSIVQKGLKYVHNDTCYPALLVIGQFIDALESGRYDVNKTALIITQTGGGCRASNYIHLLRKALSKAGFGQVPVISLNLSGLEKHSGFSLTLALVRRLLAALVYGDAVMLLNNQVCPYEESPGESAALVERWTRELSEQINHGKGMSLDQIKENLAQIVQSFAKIRLHRESKVKVGIVGEIYIKYSRLGNNNLEGFLAGQGCEVCVPGILGFILFKIDNRLEDIKLYGGSRLKKAVIQALMNYVTKIEGALIQAVKEFSDFLAPSSYQHTKKLVDGVIGYGSKMGEGWLLTAEMLELAESGYGNIICAQPFGCLPNHIVGKGMIRKIRTINPAANIVPIDYDPSATRVNQENRIKLMLAVAREQLFGESGRA